MSAKNLGSSKRKQQKGIIIFDVRAEREDETGGLIEAGVGEKILRVFGLKPKEISIEKIQENVSQFVSNMQQIIDKSSMDSGQYKIDTVEVDARVSAEGQIGLMGTHVGVGGEAGIKFIFKRL